MKSMTAKFYYKTKYLYINLTYKPNKLNKKIKFPIENITKPLQLQFILEEWIDDFCKKNPEYLQKEVLRAFARANVYMENLYKLKYKHGGVRNHTKQNLKTKTEQLGKRLTPEEKECLLQCLNVYRVISPKEKELLLKYFERCCKKYVKTPLKENRYIKKYELLQELNNIFE